MNPPSKRKRGSLVGGSRAYELRYGVRAVAQRIGVPTATLRSWNQRYGVGPPDHSPGRHRLYSDADIAVVQQMHQLIADGASPRAAARAATDSVIPARAGTEPLLAAAFALDLVAVEHILDGHSRHFGVLDTWEQLVRPAFADIETRQADGHGCIDVEHALSWTVSRSLHRLPVAAGGSSASIILACPQGEAHTLALEALRAALGERQRHALMLGADVPTAALLDALGRHQTRVTVVLWAQTVETADVPTVRTVAMQADVLVGGPGWESASVPAEAVRIDSLDRALSHFELAPRNQ